jgi:hypothetical protein
MPPSPIADEGCVCIDHVLAPVKREPSDQALVDLRATLEHKAQVCETLEARVGYKTRVIAQQDAYIARLEREQQTALLERQAWLEERAVLRAQLDTAARGLASLLDSVQHGGCKRARASHD